MNLFHQKQGGFLEKVSLYAIKERVCKTINEINMKDHEKIGIPFRNIYIGVLIYKLVQHQQQTISRICNFLNVTEDEVDKMYQSKSIDTDMLLRWSKLLKYDLFRIYSQHLILYSPSASMKLVNKSKARHTEEELPRFRKNVYTIEIIAYILNLIHSKEKTIAEIIEEYNIPKTTIYRWQKKYNKNK